MKLFYCSKCCQLMRARDDIVLLICDCGNRLVEDGLLQPMAREFPMVIPKKRFTEIQNVGCCMDMSLFFSKKYPFSK